MARLLLPLLPLLYAVAGLQSGASVCRGYGSRLSTRIGAIEASATPTSVTGSQPATRPQAALQRLYSSFVDTALRSFRGASILNSPDDKPAFESEAEHWVSMFSGSAGSRSSSSSSSGSSIGHSAILRNVTVTTATATAPAISNTTTTFASSANGTSASGSHAVGPVAALGGALRSCLGLLHESLMARVDARPPSFARQPAAALWNGVVLLSGGDRNAALSDRVVANHAAFAARRGYAYWWYRGSMVAQLGWQPYWHKIAMLRRAQSRFPAATAFVWLDDDIVLTNFAGEDMLLAALRRSNASVLATRDPASWVALNTGIVLVRNDAAGREALEEVWRRATAPRDDGISLAFDTQASCLHEQQALQEMLKEPYWRTRVGVLAQRVDAERDDTAAAAATSGAQVATSPEAEVAVVQQPSFNLNTFLRWSHYNAERDSHLRFDGDAYGSGWVRGDFAGHCSGLSSVRRALCVAVLLGSVVTA